MVQGTREHGKPPSPAAFVKATATSRPEETYRVEVAAITMSHMIRAKAPVMESGACTPRQKAGLPHFLPVCLFVATMSGKLWQISRSHVVSHCTEPIVRLHAAPQ